MLPAPRPARIQDAARLAELAGQLGYPAGVRALEERWRAFAGDPGQAVFVVEDEGGRVQGWVHVQHVRALLSEPYVEVVGLVVDEGTRGRGHGRRLLARAEDWARERGVRVVRLRSRSSRERAHAFYLRAGYAVRKTQLCFERELEPPAAP